MNCLKIKDTARTNFRNKISKRNKKNENLQL